MSRIVPVFLLLLCEGLLFAQADPREACAADLQKLCPNVPEGGGLARWWPRKERVA